MSLCAKTKSYISKFCQCDLTGKKVLITGANSGIGYKTAETLIYLGASVILACRNEQKASKAKNDLLIDYPSADIEIIKLDVSDFASIDAFAEHLPDVDVFINNAGIYHHPNAKTKDGFELVMGTNYIGVYYLSEKVMPRLQACGHEVIYINTVSLVHKFAKIDYDRFYSNRFAYSRSKLCLVRYTEHLARKYDGTNVKVYMSHPGIAVTPIAYHFLGRLYRFARFAPFNSPEKSSLSAAYILSHSLPCGSVVGPDKLFGGWGYPKLNKKVKRATQGIDELLDFTAKEVDNKMSR